MMEEMKNDPSYHEKIEPKLEHLSSFSCSLCESPIFKSDFNILEDCPHMFHRVCIEKCIEIINKSEKICCPVQGCRLEIQCQFLESYASKEIIRKYLDGSIERMIKSGKLGKIIKCPNNKCNSQYSVDDQNGFCPWCGVQICGKCLKVYETCSCNPVVMKRECPDCKNWMNKSNEKITKCNQCSALWCFDCIKKPAQCKCHPKNPNWL